MGDTLSPGESPAPTHSITSVALQCDGKRPHTHRRCQCAFVLSYYLFIFLGGGTTGGSGPVLGHCSLSEGKTNRLLVDLNVRLLFLEDGEGKLAARLPLKRASCPPRSVSLLCLFNHALMQTETTLHALCTVHGGWNSFWAFYCT